MTVRVEKLTKTFGGKARTPAVSRVSFEATEGEITTLLGPSGSGKSTVLRLIAGLETPDSGAIYIGGEDATRLPPRERGVGFVFQSYALFPHMTVRENIAFGLSIRKEPHGATSDRVDELLELIQLTHVGARYPAQLSGGQRQRVALARSLAVHPRVLLLDEPFGALDAQVRKELRDWLVTLHEKTRLTTLLVTHDQEEALELSDQVVLLAEGQVVQAGPPHELYDHPKTPFAASFLGGASRLTATVHDQRAHVGDVGIPVPDGIAEGERVHAFVRPHNVRIRKIQGDTDERVARATVQRVSRVGDEVKVQLELGSGEMVAARVSQFEAASLELSTGDSVFVDMVFTKVFHEDYTI